MAQKKRLMEYMNSSKSPFYTLITGASHGIGRALAEECAQQGMNLALIALPDDQLLEVKKRLAARYEIRIFTLGVDLTRDDAVDKIDHWLKNNSIRVNILINNAGIGSSGHFGQIDPREYEKQIRLNIMSVVMLSRHLIEELKKNGPSHLMNVGSLAGFTGIPYKSIYTATKAFVNNFTMALQRELNDSSVEVTLLCPGSVATNAEGIDRAQKHGWIARKSIMKPEQVARKGIKAMKRGRSKVIPGLFNRFFYLLTRILPSSLQSLILMSEFKKEIGPQKQSSLAGESSELAKSVE